MYRGTTPTLNFTLPFLCDQLDYVSIAFAQKKTPYDKDSTVVMEKLLTDCSKKEKTLSLTLSETDTLLLDCHYPVEIQLRVKCNGASMASDIITEDVQRILKEGCLP